MQQVVFALLAVITLGAAFRVVTSPNLIHSALWLILAFFGIAAVIALLNAEFLAAAQVLIYVGAIATLIIFAIMLSRNVADTQERRFNDQWGLVGGFSTLLFVSLAVIVSRVDWPIQQGDVPADAILRLGTDLVGPYVIPFEAASVLLVVAMIGAIIIAREHE